MDHGAKSWAKNRGWHGWVTDYKWYRIIVSSETGSLWRSLQLPTIVPPRMREEQEQIKAANWMIID